MVYRLEAKQMVRRAKKISNAHIFEAVISRDAAHRRLVDDLLGLFGGQAQPVMAHLIESGKLTLDDIKAAEKPEGRDSQGSQLMIAFLLTHLWQSTRTARGVGAGVHVQAQRSRRSLLDLVRRLQFLVPLALLQQLGDRLGRSLPEPLPVDAALVESASRVRAGNAARLCDCRCRLPGPR